LGNLANNYYTGLRFPTGSYITSGGRTGLPLNTAFTYASAGAALGIRYQVRSLAPIDEIYVLVDTAIGTLGNIMIGCDIRNEHTTSATQPGTTIRASATDAAFGIAAGPKWVRLVFPTPYTPYGIGETLWFVLRNASAAPTVDYPNMLVAFNAGPAYFTHVANQGFFSTVNGYTTAGTNQTRVPHVVRQGGKSYGSAVSILNAAVLASSTSAKGFQITPPVDIEVCGWQTAIANGNMSSIRIYDSATPPIGTPLHTFPLGTDLNESRDELIGAKFFPPIILYAGVSYNVVVLWGATGAIGGASIEDYASFPTIFDDLTDGFINCWPVYVNATEWALLKSGYINQQLIVSDILKSGSRANFALGI